MKQQLLELKQRALLKLESISDLSALEAYRITYLGKKGEIKAAMKKVGALPGPDRPEMGKLANQIKARISNELKVAKVRIESGSLEEGTPFDATLPGRRPQRGHLHPVTQVSDEICQILCRMGFQIVKGPNIELDYYNFEALNIPKDHPARDMQDTFYLAHSRVLRTQTSPMQVRTMEKQAPPVSIISPGKVYRRDSDVSHTPMFHQVEGLLVDRDVTLGDLKGTLTSFVHQMFGSDTSLRFRPSFFPFTEPSAEVDIRCVICKGQGCRTCSTTGWLEILGSGMVDPAVYGFVDYDPEVYTGFAFGLGIERIAMLKYGIDDIQLFFKNDLRFLRQF